MSFVIAAPESVASAASDLSGLGSALRAANFAAAPATTSVLAAAQDEVSAAIAALFGAHGAQYQALSAQVAAFHDEFVQALSSGGLRYASAEAANASPLGVGAANGPGPWETFTGRPLFGNGKNGTPGTGEAGGNGGWLFGNGGNGGTGGGGGPGGP